MRGLRELISIRGAEMRGAYRNATTRTRNA
jgi:hypothetical protein